MRMKPLIATVALAALAASPLPSVLMASSGIDMAFAKAGGNGNGNAGSNGNGNGNGQSSASVGTALGNSGATDSGKLASELKGLNAYHASETAMANASANSQVGRIASYRDAAEATIGAETALSDAEAALGGLTEPSRSVADIQAEIDGLDPVADAEAIAGLEAELADAEAYAAAVSDVELAADALADAQTVEDDSFLAASNDRVLSDEAMSFFRAQLGL